MPIQLADVAEEMSTSWVERYRTFQHPPFSSIAIFVSVSYTLEPPVGNRFQGGPPLPLPSASEVFDHCVKFLHTVYCLDTPIRSSPVPFFDKLEKF